MPKSILRVKFTMYPKTKYVGNAVQEVSFQFMSLFKHSLCMKVSKNYFGVKLSETAEILYFFTDLVYTNEALYGIDELIWSTTIRPSFNLEVVVKAVMVFSLQKPTLKAVTRE